MTPVTHADTLRTWAAQYITPAAREPFLAGADALDAVGRVRELLASLRRSQEFSRRRWDATCDTWDGATSDALEYALTLITEALKGDTE